MIVLSYRYCFSKRVQDLYGMASIQFQILILLAGLLLLVIIQSLKTGFQFQGDTEVEEQEATTPVHAVPIERIPHTLWFTYKHNILATKQPTHYYNNIVKTIHAYHDVWNNDTEMEVHFLIDSNCTDLLKQVDEELNLSLTNAFLGESYGQFKADLCRIAAIYLHGGYYFDIDIEVFQPLLLVNEVSFSSVISATNIPTFFQAYLASVPRHPIIRRNLDTLDEFYSQEGECWIRDKRGGNVGCCTLMSAWNQTKNKGNVKMLEEIYLNHDIHDGAYRHVPFRGSTDLCHYIVHDPEEHQVYFYSRITGSRICDPLF